MCRGLGLRPIVGGWIRAFAAVGVLAATLTPAATAGMGSAALQKEFGFKKGVTIQGLVTGPDHNLWFADQGCDIKDEFGKVVCKAPPAIVRVDAHSGRATLFSAGLSSTPVAITPGPDGNLWFTETGNGAASISPKIGRINPGTGHIDEFNLAPGSGGPDQITAGADGNLWFTENGTGPLEWIHPASGQVDQITYANDPTNDSLQADSITAGPDGNVWFDSPAASAIGRINLSTHAVTMFTTTASYLQAGIAAGGDGNMWFADLGCEASGSGPCALVRVNPATGAMRRFKLDMLNFPTQLVRGAGLWLWLLANGPQRPAIGRFNTSTGHVDFFSTGSVYANDIAMGPDGHVWFLQTGAGQPDSAAVFRVKGVQLAGCRVPKVIGKSLGQARAKLRAAGCAVGNVSKPKHKRRHKHLVVARQSISAGASVPVGTRVNLKLKYE